MARNAGDLMAIFIIGMALTAVIFLVGVYGAVQESRSTR